MARLRVTESGHRRCLQPQVQATVATILRETGRNEAIVYCAMQMAADSRGRLDATDEELMEFIAETMPVIALLIVKAEGK